MSTPQHTHGGNGIIGLLPVAISGILFVWFLTLVPVVADGGILRTQWTWVPSLGITLSFLVDGLSLTFALLITGIGALVHLYSNTYLAGHPQFARFALFLTSFMLAMLGLVLADNLIGLFVFWELTTITSYLLIGFGHETAKGRRSALQALFVTGAGALAMLAGFILLGTVAGSFELSEILSDPDAIKGSGLYVPILLLILAGTFTKSAQFPFHFWLPNAMAAPTPVSAFLHSATMVKAGVYLMARLHPGLSGTDLWMWSLTIFGAVTAVLASILALRQTDLKQALAYTTLMALGTLTLFLGQESGYAMTAFATFLIVHSLYKAALFLIVGCIDHETGTRETAILGGLARFMPITAFAAALSALSMAGFPPFLGFIGKELKYAGALAVGSEPLFVAGAVLVANALMLAVAGVVAFKPFWRPAGGEMPKKPHEAPWPMLVGPVLLAIAGAAFGIYPDLLQRALVAPTVASLLGNIEDTKELKLWAGVNLPLILSVVTVALGLVLYLTHVRLRAFLASLLEALPNFDRGWDKFLVGFKAFAAWQTRLIQSGVLRSYMFWTFLTTLVGLAGTMIARDVWVGLPDLSDVTWKYFALIAFLIGGAALTTITSSRIAAMAGLGVTGIGVALIFIVFSAPDVAITQLLVETLVVVLVAVALLRLPTLDSGGRKFRKGDAVLATAVGGTVTLIILAVLDTPLDRRLTDYFEVTSWPEAFGRNIVNVILVDFRALDTFGEIAVVVIAALASYALLRTTPKMQQASSVDADHTGADAALDEPARARRTNEEGLRNQAEPDRGQPGKDLT
ncbi:putative monovalent cation/H+ antiporter subunit A [Cognatishimia sp. F0-27]|uniref:putative monovalent cation/H+ antiporter subunit A n=1 Tax=Cognatishimia sp. F0-27 TaxID=2816855 RepID=UPI001D0C9720|nr:putative monovalent cation/H+ antiporter subunit A [Cognatishimia sp. F0-27]MCC1491835.1 putative monovalent cation/H+ antiporter subunit A [Cognatishimia sp. F0-27]